VAVFFHSIIIVFIMPKWILIGSIEQLQQFSILMF
jgi:hypothetical protein